MEESVEHPVPSPGAASRWIMRLLALAALAISVFLAVQSLRGGSIPGCGPDSKFDCDSVLASKWSKWFGIPVSEIAGLLYVVMLGALAYVGPACSPAQKRMAWRILLGGSFMVMGAAIWFVALQLVKLDAVCIWCMAAHACGFVLGVWINIVAPVRSFHPPMKLNAALAAGLLGVAVLVTGQVLSEEQTVKKTWVAGQPDIDEGAGEERTLTLLGGRIRGLKPSDYPLVGSPNAEHVAVYIFDYTCPHCHEQHDNLVKARERYGNELAIIPMVMPLDGDCNPEVSETQERHATACELAKLSLAVYRADGAKFAQFHEWMFGADEPRPVDEARQQAIDLVGQDALVAAEADPWIDQEIKKHIALYGIVSQMAQHRAIPMIVVRAMIVAGQPGSPEELFRILESEEAGIVPPADAEPLPEEEKDAPQRHGDTEKSNI